MNSMACFLPGIGLVTPDELLQFREQERLNEIKAINAVLNGGPIPTFDVSEEYLISLGMPFWKVVAFALFRLNSEDKRIQPFVSVKRDGTTTTRTLTFYA